MPQHIRVVEYDPRWSVEYRREKDAISAVLSSNCLAVYHIGSTSVPGLCAKPVIDIMAVVKSLDKVDASSDAFVRLGYEYMGEYGIPGRRYLRKGGDERTHQLHIFKVGDWKNISRHLAFRDFLRADEDSREAYGKLKRTLALRFPYDIDSYCDGKEEFVREMEKKALLKYDSDWDRLYIVARNVQGHRVLSPFMEAGAVSAAILTSLGNIYVGICIDTACSLGMCAERNAIANMITNGESRIEKVVAVMPDGEIGMPCGACRELMMQLHENAGETKILCNLETKRTVALKSLLPDWWKEN